MSTIHLTHTYDDRTVSLCTDPNCELFPDDNGFTDHVRSLPVIGWVERGRKMHNGKVEWRFTPDAAVTVKFPVRLGNYSAAFQDAKGYAATLNPFQ